MSAPAADPEALRQALAEPGLQTTLERASWRDYPAAVVEAFFEALERRLRALHLPIDRESLQLLAWIVVALLLAAIAIVLVRALAGRGRAPKPVPPVTPAPPRLEPRDAPAWRERLEQRLAAGDVRGALEATWWWLATRLAADVEASRTTREVVLQARRRDMLPLAQRLDRLTFGAGVPGLDDVRGLVRDLEGRLA